MAFDVREDRFDVLGDPARTLCSVYRLLSAIIEIVTVGALVVDARISRTGVRTCRCVLTAGSSGLLLAHDDLAAILLRLGMTEERTERAGPQRAVGTCPASSQSVQFVWQPGAGAAFHLEIDSEIVSTQSSRRVEGARAWIVDHDPFRRNSLALRLERRGWATGQFKSCASAIARLSAMPSAYSRPALVAVADGGGAHEACAADLRPSLPDRSSIIVLATSGSQSLNAPHDGFETWTAPLSQRDLDDLAQRVNDAQSGGSTEPAPMRLADRGRMLVVDDQELNRLLAGYIGEQLGFAVETANCGAEALERCKNAAPDIVLMDISMPEMDGFETTRRLRRLQRQGLVAPFGIVAATTEHELRDRCIEAGMDDYLVKPLRPEELRPVLRRLCHGCVLNEQWL